MSPLALAYLLRDHITAGTRDGSTIWFRPESTLGSLLITSAERGHFEVAATLAEGMLVLHPRLTEFLTDVCPAWSEIFDQVAGRLVLLDARLMLPGRIESLEAIRMELGVLA